MNVTLEQIVVSEPALKALSTTRLPIKAAYSVSKMIRLIGPELADFNAQRNALILELGEKDEDSGNTSISPDMPAFEEFAAKVKELIGVSVELPGVTPLTLSAFGDADLTPETLLQLGPFVVEEEDV